MFHFYNKFQCRVTLPCDIKNCNPANWPIRLLEINTSYNNYVCYTHRAWWREYHWLAEWHQASNMTETFPSVCPLSLLSCWHHSGHAHRYFLWRITTVSPCDVSLYTNSHTQCPLPPEKKSKRYLLLFVYYSLTSIHQYFSYIMMGHCRQTEILTAARYPCYW